jgi:hypothetical protein
MQFRVRCEAFPTFPRLPGRDVVVEQALGHVQQPGRADRQAARQRAAVSGRTRGARPGPGCGWP